MIGVIGDYDPGNKTHVGTNDALASLDERTPFEWVATSDVERDGAAGLKKYAGLLIAPGSPYASMDGALLAIKWSREEGVPLVGT